MTPRDAKIRNSMIRVGCKQKLSLDQKFSRWPSKFIYLKLFSLEVHYKVLINQDNIKMERSQTLVAMHVKRHFMVGPASASRLVTMHSYYTGSTISLMGALEFIC